jgi:hypothetical protein
LVSRKPGSPSDSATIPEEKFNRDFGLIKRNGTHKSSLSSYSCQNPNPHVKLRPFNVATGASLRFLCVILSTIAVLMLTFVGMAEAAKKKPATPPPPKAIYEAPMRFFIVRNSNPACEPECPEWIGAEGEITGATPAQFKKVLKQMGKKKLPVIIRSPGGSINAALEISRMIRKAGLTVAVGYTRFSSCAPTDKTCKLAPEKNGIYEGTIDDVRAFCNSACPMVLAGGTQRLAGPFASIGLHEPKTVWTRQQVRYRETYRMVRGKKKVISRKIVSRKNIKDKVTYGLDKALRKKLSQHYKSMGVEVAILEDTVKAKYQDVYYISEIRKSMLKLVTSSSSAVMLANPSFCGSVSVCVTDNKRAQPVTVPKTQDDGVMRPVLAMPDKMFCPKQCPIFIYAEGKITKETVAAFKKLFFDMGGRNPPVILQSTEGDLAAGMELGNLLRQYNRDVAVAKVTLWNCSPNVACGTKIGKLRVIPSKITEVGDCESSCTLALAGGRQRIGYSHVPLGFASLAAYKTSNISEQVLTKYFEEMGLQADLITAIRSIKVNARGALVGKSQALRGVINSGKLPTWLANPELCQTKASAINCI